MTSDFTKKQKAFSIISHEIFRMDLALELSQDLNVSRAGFLTFYLLAKKFLWVPSSWNGIRQLSILVLTFKLCK